MTCLQSFMSIYLLANDLQNLQNIHIKLRHLLFWNLILTGNILDEPVCLCGLKEETHQLLFCVKILFVLWCVDVH